MTTKPLNNNVLIEVQQEYADVSRGDDNEDMNCGILIDFSVDHYHLTASAAVQLDDKWWAGKWNELERFKGHLVRWEQYAEGGQTFKEDGKTYALIPWWRLLSVTENDEDL